MIADAATRPAPVRVGGTWTRVALWLATSRAEALIVFGLLLATFWAFLFRLDSLVISDIDEGTYLYAGKLIADGLTPYRDFMLVHPPLTMYLVGAWFHLAGTSVTGVRVANLVLFLVSSVPLYFVTRAIIRSRTAALLALATYTSGVLLLADLGRTVKLEPVMNAFLISAFAIYVLRPRSSRWRLVLGALVGAALLVKLVAVLPIGLLVLGDLIWGRSPRRWLTVWLTAAAGAAVVLVPSGLYLLSLPHFVDDVLLSQLQREGMPLQERLTYVVQNLTHYPPVAVALLASVWFVVRRADTRLRVASLIVALGLFSLVVVFKSFFAYYVVMLMPWVAILFAAVCYQVARQLTASWRPLLACGALALGVAVPLVYEELYFRASAMHTASPSRVLAVLQSDSGPIYSMYPLFALWSGRPEYAWYYAADSLMPRFTKQLTSDDLIQAFSGSQAVVLWRDELVDYPVAQAYLEARYQLAYHDDFFIVWLRPAAQG